MRPKVYLAGPITGLTYDQGQDWRLYARKLLGERGIDGYSPLRAQEHLKAHGVLEGEYAYNPHTTDRGIMVRDRWDISTADVVLANLLGAKGVSIGTCMELGMADILRKPVVIVMEETGNPHEHPMVHEAVGFRVTTLEDGLRFVVDLLNP